MRSTQVKRLAVLALFISFISWSVPVRALSQTSKIDLAGMDRTVDPGDDFSLYSNGGWMRSTEIPGDRAAYGAFDVIFNVVARRTAQLITDPGQSNEPGAK